MYDESGAGRRAHQLILQERQRLSLSGVESVESFEETLAVFGTVMGELTVRGNGLQLERSDTETGEVVLQGTVSECSYADPPEPKTGSWLRRLFRP